MKSALKLLPNFALLAIVVSSGQAEAFVARDFATRQVGTYQAQMTEFEMDQKLGLAPVRSGQVEVDYNRREVTLRLQVGGIICPPKAFCIMAMPPKPVEITLPITSIVQNRCGGGPVIIAEEDLRPVDGFLKRFTVFVGGMQRTRCGGMNPAIDLDSAALVQEPVSADGFVIRPTVPAVLNPGISMIYETVSPGMDGKVVETRSHLKGVNYHRVDVRSF